MWHFTYRESVIELGTNQILCTVCVERKYNIILYKPLTCNLVCMHDLRITICWMLLISCWHFLIFRRWFINGRFRWVLMMCFFCLSVFASKRIFAYIYMRIPSLFVWHFNRILHGWTQITLAHILVALHQVYCWPSFDYLQSNVHMKQSFSRDLPNEYQDAILRKAAFD